MTKNKLSHPLLVKIRGGMEIEDLDSGRHKFNSSGVCTVPLIEPCLGGESG